MELIPMRSMTMIQTHSQPTDYNPGMKNSPTAAEFTDFCWRFVRNYWNEIAQGTPELPGSEPCEQSLEELLSEIEYSSSCEHDGIREFTLRMMNTTGDVWRFKFRPKNGQWVIQSATSGSHYDEARVNWLDAVYSPWFLPLLNRVIRKSL
jgi:hypothetical protein